MNKSTTVTKSFEGMTLNVIPDSVHEFVMTTGEVAKGYGVVSDAIRQVKVRHADELAEGKHYFSSVTNCNSRHENLQKKTTYWTKRGIVRLGFFIKSAKAKHFRDWAEDLIIGKSQAANEVLSDDDAFLKEANSIKDFLAPFGLFNNVKFVPVKVVGKD